MLTTILSLFFAVLWCFSFVIVQFFLSCLKNNYFSTWHSNSLVVRNCSIFVSFWTMKPGEHFINIGQAECLRKLISLNIFIKDGKKYPFTFFLTFRKLGCNFNTTHKQQLLLPTDRGKQAKCFCLWSTLKHAKRFNTTCQKGGGLGGGGSCHERGMKWMPGLAVW